MDLISLFFSFKGRIGRGAYFAGNFLINLMNIPGRLTTSYYEGSGAAEPPVLALGFALLSLLLLYPTAAVMVKRGHDRAKPAWFSIALLLSAFVAIQAAYVLKNFPSVAVAGVLVVYQVIEYLCWPASPKAKKYDEKRQNPVETAQVFS